MTDDANSTFVYVTYIRANPERLWAALTNPAEMKRFWFGMHCDSDFRAGSPWRLVFTDGRVADSGEILEADPPKRLVIHWVHEWRPELAAEGPAKCVIDLEPQNGATKLTVTHSIAREKSKLIEAVSGGWPQILSNLKSLIETGEIAFSRE